MKFLILGSTGMAGHLITAYLREHRHEDLGLSRRKILPHVDIALDVTDFEELAEIIRSGKFNCVVNCVGILNRAAEDNKTLAIRLNSELPHFLAETTADLPTKIIQLGTYCIFSDRSGGYREDDFPDGKTFYDRTKALGELVDEKKSVWSGATTLFLAQMIERAASENIQGLYQLTNNTPITKHELLKVFAKVFHKEIKISPVEGVAADKTLINTKNFGLAPPYEEMLIELRDWMIRHKNFYPHYREIQNEQT